MTADYDLHGVRLQVRTAEREIASALNARLGWFRTEQPSVPHWVAEFSIENDPADHIPPPAGKARPIYKPEAGAALYFPDTDEIYITLPTLCLRVDLAGGTARFTVGHGNVARWLATHAVLTLPLLEFLKRHGFFSLHAAGVTHGGKSLLLAGANGAGKTTLALALVHAGLSFQGDDLVFLEHGDAGLRSLAFPEPVGVSPNTLTLLPELKPLARVAEISPVVGKHEIDLAAAARASIESQASPAALVLLQRPAGDGPYSLEPHDRASALADLLPNVLLTEDASSDRHLQTLAEFVETVPCYRLAGSGSPREAARLVAELLGAEALVTV